MCPSYTEIRGAGKPGSANAPTGIAIIPGMRSPTKPIVDPQVGQNRKVVRVPLSPVRDHSVNAPVIATSASGQRACTAKALPDRVWHSRQWHTDTRTGSPLQAACNAPHRQLATRDVIP